MIETPRRMFLQTAGATLVVPFIGGGLALAQTKRRRDPVLTELLKQAKAAAAKASRSTLAPHGEAARQLANTLRILSAHGATIGLGAALDKALKSAIARDGRAAFLSRRVDTRAVRSELGLDVDSSQLGAPVDDYATRSAALDALLKNGFGQAWQTAAQSLDEIAARIDGQRGNVRLVKQSAADCASGQWALMWLEFAMLAACGPWAGPLWPETCGIASAAYLTYRISLMIMGCL